MNVKFDFESLSRAGVSGEAAHLEVTLEVSARSLERDLLDYSYEVSEIWDTARNCEVQFISLPVDEQVRLITVAETRAAAAAPAAHAEAEEGYLDWSHDYEK